jgi:hypothetical protein
VIAPELLQLLAVVIWDHGLGAWGPAGWTHLAIGVTVLEALDESKGFAHIPADWEIIHSHVTEDTLIVNDKGSTKCDTCIGTAVNIHTIILRNLLGDVAEQWDFHSAEATLIAGLHSPLTMNEMTIDTAAKDNTTVLGCEGLSSVSVLNDLGRAHKCEIKWPEEEHNILPAEVRETDLLEAVHVPSLGGKVWGWLLDDCLWSITALCHLFMAASQEFDKRTATVIPCFLSIS